jgi:diacylglycerol kinase
MVVVVVSTGDPHMFVVIPMLIAVVIALAIAVARRCDHATRTQHGESQKKAADYGSFCVIHGVS